MTRHRVSSSESRQALLAEAVLVSGPVVLMLLQTPETDRGLCQLMKGTNYRAGRGTTGPVKLLLLAAEFGEIHQPGRGQGSFFLSIIMEIIVFLLGLS